MEAQVAVITRNDFSALITHLAARVVRANDSCIAPLLFLVLGLVVDERGCGATLSVLAGRAVIQVLIQETSRSALLRKLESAGEERSDFIADQVANAELARVIIHAYGAPLLPRSTGSAGDARRRNGPAWETAASTAAQLNNLFRCVRRFKKKKVTGAVPASDPQHRDH